LPEDEEEDLSATEAAYERRGHRGRLAWDDDAPDPEASTYVGAEHGPEPVPDWVITEDRARQYELGILKSGKEADVHLVQRLLDDRSNLLAAKRYRSFEDRMFRNDARYRSGRRTGSSRVDRAVAKGTTSGMAFRAQQWVENEFDALSRLWSAGVSVPYPVQRLGREILSEYIGDDEGAAPRLAQVRADSADLERLYEQLVENLVLMTECGVVHGDLSAYNLLVWQERLVIIDLPQAADPIANPDGLSLLERDVVNVCGWFAKKGIRADAGELRARLVGRLFRA
jgi:RIO kinase 1